MEGKIQYATQAKKKRLANIELLRILAMAMIVCNHFFSHGIGLMDYDFNNPNVEFSWLLRGICYMGTNLFILISSYFLCRSKFKAKGLLLLICQTFFYSIIIYIVTYLLGWHSLNVKQTICSLFPIVTSQYWFVTCYVALYVLSPFLNSFINTLVKSGQNVYRKFLVVLLVFFSVIPSILYFSPWLNWGGSSGIVWFIVLYFIGGYIRNYASIENLQKNKTRIWILTLLCWIAPLVSKIIIAYFSQWATGEVVGSSIFYVKNSIIIVPASILTFLAFLSFEINSSFISKAINFTASSVFSVYLISEHNFVRSQLWSFVTEHVNQNSTIFILQTFAIIATIFIICIAIDLIRKVIFKLLAKTNIPQRISRNLIRLLDNAMLVG